MFIGLAVLSILTGTMSAELSSAAVNGNIQSIHDLKPNDIICTPSPLYATDYLANYNVHSYLSPKHSLEECFNDLKAGVAHAVFYDETTLRYELSRNIELSNEFKVLSTENGIVLGGAFPKTLNARPNKLRFDEIFLNFKERESAKLAALYQKYFPSYNLNEQEKINYDWRVIGFATAFLGLYALASIYDSYFYGDLDSILPNFLNRRKVCNNSDEDEKYKLNEKAKKEDDGDKDHDKDRDALDNNIDIEMVHICNPMVNSHGINNDAASKRLQLKRHHRRRRGSMIHHAGHARPIHIDSPEFVQLGKDIDNVHVLIRHQQQQLEQILSCLHPSSNNNNKKMISKGNEEENSNKNKSTSNKVTMKLEEAKTNNEPSQSEDIFRE